MHVLIQWCIVSTQTNEIVGEKKMF